MTAANQDHVYDSVDSSPLAIHCMFDHEENPVKFHHVKRMGHVENVQDWKTTFSESFDRTELHFEHTPDH